MLTGVTRAMSKGQRQRHPVLWPRMKIRGAYRKWLAAQRIETVYIIPHAVSTVDTNSRVVAGMPVATTFRAASEGTPGAVRLELRTWRDGFGRSVKRP